MNALYPIYKSQSIEQQSLTPPKTPPAAEFHGQFFHPWPEPETAAEDFSPQHRNFDGLEETQDATGDGFNVPHQEVLLLHGPKQRYAHTREQPLPKLENDREMLVAVHAVGLNPIDWKAP
jgi:hypothetical protein